MHCPRTFWFSHILISITCLCLTSRSREIAFEAQTSRYLNEFEELAILGKGGYGRVYKVVFYLLILTDYSINILRSGFHYYDVLVTVHVYFS